MKPVDTNKLTVDEIEDAVRRDNEARERAALRRWTRRECVWRRKRQGRRP